MLYRVGIFLTVLVLATACGGGAAPAAPTTAATPAEQTANATATLPQDDLSTANSNSTIEITGAQTASIKAVADYACLDPLPEQTGGVQLSFAAASGQSLLISLPMNALAGTFEFTAGTQAPEGNKAAATIVLGASNVYVSQTGTLTLEELASGPNQPVMGTFDFTAASASDPSKTITLKGAFNFNSISADGEAQVDISDYYCGDK